MHGTDFGADDPRDQVAILKTEGQRNAHIQNGRQYPVGTRHFFGRGVAPTVIARREAMWLRCAKPFQFDPAFRAATHNLADRIGTPVQKKELDLLMKQQEKKTRSKFWKLPSVFVMTRPRKTSR